ncbi:MAG: hypothetical protein SGJ00_10025 [bacterium]|nr:hypothetical protein [bacterium]
METVTKVLLFLGKMILNLAGIIIGWYLYIMYVRPLAQGAILPEYFQEIIAVILLMIGLPLLSLKRIRPINNFSVGVMGLIIPLILLGIFGLNQSSSARSYKRLYPIERKAIDQGDLVLSVYIYEKSNWIQLRVPKDNCYKLDSVEIKMIDGLLGLKVMTKEIEFSKKPGCEG